MAARPGRSAAARGLAPAPQVVMPFPQQPSPGAPTRAGDRVPFAQKLAIGMGEMASIGRQSIDQLALPVYNIMLGGNPLLVTMVVRLVRFLDALTDPLAGSLS